MSGRKKAGLFDQVECTGYLKKVAPKWQLVITDEHNFKGHFHSTEWKDGKYHNLDVAVNFEDEDVINTYYELKEQKFTGVVVGFKDIVTKGRLYAVTLDFPDGSQRAGCSKEPAECESCVVVAYGNNRRHLVPTGNIANSMIEEAMF